MPLTIKRKVSKTDGRKIFPRGKRSWCLLPMRPKKAAHYITATAFLPETDLRDVRVLDITYDGHMFLRSIQDITIWSTLKQRIGPALNASLPVLSEMAGKILLSKFP